MKGRIIQYDRPDKRVLLEVDGNFDVVYDRLNGKDINVEFKKWSDKRTGAANRYMWVLVDMIAAATHQDKRSIYREAIREIGGVSDIIHMKTVAVKRFCEQWECNGIGWQTEVIEGEEESDVIAYYGSSTFNKDQMTELIENLIFQAEHIGLNTDTPDKEAWWMSLEG